MSRVNISALKSGLSKHLRAAERGEVVEVMDRKRPIARLVGVGPTTQLETIPPVRPFSEVRRLRPSAVKLRIGSLELLTVERGDR